MTRISAPEARGRAPRFAGAISICLGVLACGGRAGNSDEVLVLPPTDSVPDEAHFGDDPSAGLSDEPSALPSSPLVPLGREWQVLATLEKDPRDLAADERFAYWVSTDVRHRDYFLRRQAQAGGDPVTLVSGRVGLRRLVPSGEYVYFEQGGTGGRIARVPREGGADETLVRSDGAQGYALDGDTLYWTQMGSAIDSGELYRTSLRAGVTELLADGLLAPQGISLHGAFVYFASERQACPGEPGAPAGATTCVGGGVHRVPRSGGAAELLHAGGGTSDLVVNDAGLYWFDAAVEQLMFAPEGGAERPIVSVALSDMGPFAFDAGALYWATQSRVQRVPFGTNAQLELGPEISLPTSVAVAGDWLYVAERGRDRIARTPTDPSTSPDYP